MSKPWYEDIKDRFNALDQRELLLQKEVARLSERVHWLVKEKEKEQTEKQLRYRWKIAILVSATIGIIDLIITILRLMK